MRTFNQIVQEKIEIKSIKWLSTIKDWTLKVNDRFDHDMLSRLQTRTNIPLKELRAKIYKGIEYTISKAEKGFFKDEAVHVGIYFKKSNFKIILNVFTNSKRITLVTVLDGDMSFHNLIKWDLNEFKLFDVKTSINNYVIVEGFSFEPDISKTKVEVFPMYEVYEDEINN